MWHDEADVVTGKHYQSMFIEKTKMIDCETGHSFNTAIAIFAMLLGEYDFMVMLYRMSAKYVLNDNA